MGIFSNLFKRNKKAPNPSKTDYSDVALFLSKYNEVLKRDAYLARSEFVQIKEEFKDTYQKYKVLKESGVISDTQSDVLSFLKDYQDLLNNYQLIKKHNDDYIARHLESEKEYFDNVLKEVDPNINLDEEQRRVCLDDEDYELIIAGAGAGKTTTLAAKVKYLIDKKKIDPKDILIIAFTNKAVNELKEKITKKLGYDVPISTFHSCGRAIMKKDDNLADTNICSTNYYFVQDYVANLIKQEPDLLQKMIILFAYYLDLTEDITKNISLEDHFTLIETSDHTTIKHNINYDIKDVNNKKTIQNEILRSNEEVQIANFLFLNNIEYKYEKPYEYKIPNANKLYTPDFYITQGNLKCYIEHFGITEDGKNSRYTSEELAHYIENMNYKIILHKGYNTSLITTYSKYNDGRTLLEHLKEELEKKGFVLKKRDDKEIYQALTKNNDSKYVYKFISLSTRFIELFKSKGLGKDDFEVLKHKTTNPRNILFLDIMERVYSAYEKYLSDNNLVDFADMINKSTKVLNDVEKVRAKVHFKYIIIDEYQDISRSRLNLVKALQNVNGAKICVVGDDWQSIYGYAGSEIDLFTKFTDQVGYASILRITKTYRNSQELIDIAGGFIQKNHFQIRKSLISSKPSIIKPISIYTYDGTLKPRNSQDPNLGAIYNRAHLLERVIGWLLEKDPKSNSILVIGRYGFDGRKLIESGLFTTNSENYNNSFTLHSIKYPNAKITFMTAHATKGLTYDNVIIINAANAKYGFPAQIDDDPVLQMVRTIDKSYEFSEERRLFYVSMTRTKNRVFILAPGQNPSTFVLELLDDYHEKINLHEEEKGLNRNVELINKKRTKCPICGYPMQFLKNDNYGVKLFICTNEPEICDYMTNDLRSGTKSIHLCNKCGGTMIVKHTLDNKNVFFGCTNYKNGSGCKNTEPIEEFKNEKEN